MSSEGVLAYCYDEINLLVFGLDAKKDLLLYSTALYEIEAIWRKR